MIPAGTTDILRNQILRRLVSGEYEVGTTIVVPYGIKFYYDCPNKEKDGKTLLTLTREVIWRLQEYD